MADVNEAVQFVLRLEDSRLSGAVTTLPGDSGGATRFGLASASHPELVEEGFYETANGLPEVPHDQALAIAENAYASQYATPVRLGQILSQDVANRVLSFAINEGPVQATKLLQRAINSLGSSLDDDGHLGPATMGAINAADPEKLIAAMRGIQKDFYRNLVASRPAMQSELKGLLNRADA